MTTRVESRAALRRVDASAPSAGAPPAGRAWMLEVRRAVDAELSRFFADKRELTRRIGGDDTLLVDAIADLTMRGGKRLRPAVLFAAHRALGGAPGEPAVLALSAALELLQSYLLIHDDWMDRDDERRGGPSVHAALRARAGQTHLGDSLAILAGDLASAYAWELAVGAATGLSCAGPLTAAFARMHQDVVLGQELDLLATRDVSRMQKLKTGSYTVEGPLRLGALLAGASRDALAMLEAFGAPLGEAFQVRDDLLGAFGDPARTGKPRGGDLRAGKRTALVLECERASLPDERALLASVLGDHEASEADVASVLAMFERTGVRDRVEARLAGLLDAARGVLPQGALSHGAALEAPALAPDGARMLLDLVDALALRDG